jgi:hypothetical protein
MSHQVIEVAASYRLSGDQEATLLLESNQGDEVVLTVLHERFAGDVCSYDWGGHACEQIVVAGGESLTMIARRYGRIIGCLVNEVDTSEASRVLLRPKGGYNLIVYQSRLDGEAPQIEQHYMAALSLLVRP